MTQNIYLRDVLADDLPVFFEHQRDPLAVQMMAFPARERDAFDAHWARIMANENIVIKTILFEGQVAGSILSFDLEEERDVGYEIGREFWGRGIASEALKQFLVHEMTRPLYGRVAKHNIASQRVLEKCGFVLVGSDKWKPDPNGEEVEELIYILK